MLCTGIWELITRNTIIYTESAAWTKLPYIQEYNGDYIQKYGNCVHTAKAIYTHVGTHYLDVIPLCVPP